MTGRIGQLILIDDNRADQRIYETVIEKSGLVERWVTFTYAEEALDYFRGPCELPVNVVLLDVRMPRMNGLEFLQAATEEFGSHFAEVVAVLLTTDLETHDRARIESFEAVRHLLVKPLTQDHLQQVAVTLAALRVGRSHN